MLDLDHIGERIRECRKKKMMTIRVLGNTGLNYECDAIAACVIGGVSEYAGTE